MNCETCKLSEENKILRDVVKRLNETYGDTDVYKNKLNALCEDLEKYLDERVNGLGLQKFAIRLILKKHKV